MGFLNDSCEFDELNEELHNELVALDCKPEPKIEQFFRDECVLSDSQMLSHTYCFYEEVKNGDAIEKHAVAGFCVSSSNVATKFIPKSTRNKINRKIPYEKQRDHYLI